MASINGYYILCLWGRLRAGDSVLGCLTVAQLFVEGSEYELYHLQRVKEMVQLCGMILEKKITFPGKKIHVPWKKYLQPLEKKFRLLWPCGPLVLWSSGPLVLWSSGPLVLVLWSCGPLVLWSCGHVVPWQRHEKKYVRTKKAWKECKRKWRKRRSGTINKYSFNNN